MPFACRPVAPDFVDTAPWHFASSVEVEASAAEIFALFEDAAAWPKWFSDIRKVEWTSPKPFGVGTTRTVTLQTATVYEHFYDWQDGAGFAFYFTGMSVPLFKALAEDYRLEALSEKRCRFTYKVGIQPTLLLALLGPIMKPKLGKMFSDAPRSLARFVAG